MVGEHCVKQYEYIIDYFETDDSTDIQEIYNLEGMEKYWDTIPRSPQRKLSDNMPATPSLLGTAYIPLMMCSCP